jgi:hypothetical protein
MPQLASIIPMLIRRRYSMLGTIARMGHNVLLLAMAVVTVAMFLLIA